MQVWCRPAINEIDWLFEAIRLGDGANMEPPNVASLEKLGIAEELCEQLCCMTWAAAACQNVARLGLDHNSSSVLVGAQSALSLQLLGSVKLKHPARYIASLC